MKKAKINIAAIGKIFDAIITKSHAFCNIAEGTHAGSITMVAGENIESSNLLVKAGSLENEVLVANASDKPIGVCGDEGSKGETVGVYLAGAAESTFICVTSSDVSSGDSLYTSAGGKVSTIAADGCYKVGVALCNATTGGVVEIDPQGFGQRGWQICACGVHTWTGATDSETLTAGEIAATDIVYASMAATAGTEKVKSACASDGAIAFALDSNGTAATTKIAWIAIRKN